MNEKDIAPQRPRILGRVLAKETTVAELEASQGEAAIKTWTLRFPPDHD